MKDAQIVLESGEAGMPGSIAENFDEVMVKSPAVLT